MDRPTKYRAIRVPACAKCWTQRVPFAAKCLECGHGEISNFDSRGEFRYWHELLLLEKAGHIRHLERQPKYRFVEDGQPMFEYRADFRYFKGERRVVVDFKGMDTPLSKLKRKLIEAQHHITIEIVKARA